MKNKQQGLSTTGDLSETGLRAVVARASDVAAHVPANPEFVSLAVPGAIGAWRKSAVQQVGGYLTDTLAEDMDLTWRLRRAGSKA